MPLPTRQDFINGKEDLDALGEMVNSPDDKLVDTRFGGLKRTLANWEKRWEEAIADTGGVPVGDGNYTAGKTYTNYNHYLVDNGTPYRAVTIPYTVDTTTYPNAADDPSLRPWVFPGELANSRIKWFATLSDLLLVNYLQHGEYVGIINRAVSGDGGGNIYEFDGTSSGIHDNGSVIDHANSGGQLRAQFPGGVVSVCQFGAAGGDDTSAYQSAINYLSAIGGGRLTVRNLASLFSASVELKPGVRIKAENSSITLDGSAVKVAFVTADHCYADSSAFAYDCAIDGMKFICQAEHPAGGNFVTYMAWHAVNVRRWSMTNCEFQNMGGGYVTHYIRYFGSYSPGTNGDEATDPAVTAGMSAAGGDLNEDLHFERNRCEVPVLTGGLKSLVQMFRYEFCERVEVHKNYSIRGAISGWGGSAIVDEGGALQHYRRCRDVNATNNFLYEPNALYWIQGYNVKAQHNTVVRGIDLGIDFEGSMYCLASDNYILNSGNGSLATFYHSKHVVFSDNICYEDGSAKDINDDFNLGTKWDPSEGKTFYLNTGAHTPDEGEDEVTLRGNTFIWGAGTGSGVIDIRDSTFIEFSENTLFDVCFDSSFNNQGRVEVINNKFNFLQDAGRAALIAIGDNEINKYAPQVKGNYLYIAVAQALPCYGMHFYQGDNDNYRTEISGNQFLHEGNTAKTSADVALQNDSVNAGRFHTYRIDGNVFGPGDPLVDLSARGAAHVLSIGDNTIALDKTTLDYTADHSGAKAFFADTLPTGFGYVSGQVFLKQDNRGETYAGIIAAANGWDLPASQQWQTATAYGIGDVVYTAGNNVYFCVAAGASSTEPVGSSVTDGTLQWVRVGNLMQWREYLELGAAVQRS